MDALVAPLLGAFEYLTRVDIILAVVAGMVIGIIVGALPGVGSTLAFGLALPFTFAMDATTAVALLLAINVGNAFGNSLPALLLGVPGSATGVLTVMEGYTLHRQGETGLALAVAFLSAVIGQAVSILFFIAAVVPLAAIAYYFLQPELFGLYLFGIVALVSLTGRNMVKGLIAAAFGLLIATIGLDPLNFVPRFTFGAFELREGLNTSAIVVGLIACSELLRQSRQVFQWGAATGRVKAIFPKFAQIRPAFKAMFIGTVVGTIVGAVPGAGGTPSALMSYQQAKTFSKTPEKFGHGSIEGLAANEAAQNADTSGELIPTLGLGIPGSSTMVLLLAALTLNGYIPGPNLVRNAPELFSATVAGLIGATILMALTGWWLSRAMLKVLTINRSVVIVLSLALVALGTYSLHYRLLDVFVCFLFGAIGYFMTRFGYSVSAAGLAVVLAEGLESNFRIGLNMFDNSLVSFFSRPITAIVVIFAIIFLALGARQTIRTAREDRTG
jgi:putative tricarboxylic transport membrane protein